MQPIVEERWRGERRGRILQAASRLFSERPFEQASMDEIAHEAGIGKPTLYRYFGSKDELFGAVFAEVLDDLERRLDRALAAEARAEARLRALAAEIVPIFRDHLVSLRLVDEAAADQSKRRVFRERQARIAARLAAAIEDGMRNGEVRDVDAPRIAQLMIGMIWSAAAAGGRSDREIARDVTDLALNGIGSAAGLDASWPAAARTAPPMQEAAA